MPQDSTDLPRAAKILHKEIDRRQSAGGETIIEANIHSLRAAARTRIPDEADSVFWYPSLHWYAVADIKVCAREQLPLKRGFELELFHAIPYVLARDEAWLEVAVPDEQAALFKAPADKPRFFIKRIEADNVEVK